MRISDQKISLCGLRFYAYHGVEPQERIVGAWYNVDLTLNVKVDASLESDNLSHTVNYAQASRIIAGEMEIPHALIESLTWSIVQRLMDELELVTGLEIKVSKMNPPVCAPCDSASFSLVVSRD